MPKSDLIALLPTGESDNAWRRLRASAPACHRVLMEAVARSYEAGTAGLLVPAGSAEGELAPAVAAGLVVVSDGVISLPLLREPGNAHDGLAIKIMDEKGHHLGYVPRAKNEALARLMDAGKLLFGRIEEKAWQGEWLKVDIRVFLRDF